MAISFLENVHMAKDEDNQKKILVGINLTKTLSLVNDGLNNLISNTVNIRNQSTQLDICVSNYLNL